MAKNGGFAPDDTVAAFVGTPPDPNDPSWQVRYYFSVLSDYQVRPENVAGLEQVLSQVKQTQVLVVEMPVPETYFYFFGAGERDYQRFLDEVGARAAAYGVPFWRTTEQHLISAVGWMDYGHMNSRGAEVFSAWLGQQVAEAVTHGVLDDPNR